MTEDEGGLHGPARSGRVAAAVFGAWLAYVAADFFTHAVILADWWRSTSDAWLAPQELFRRIPYGYASFALYCAGLVWVGRYAGVFAKGSSPRIFVYGLVAGAAYGLASGTALYSVVDAPASSIAVWSFSAAFGSSAAALAAGHVLLARSPSRSVAVVLGTAVLALALGVIAQNIAGSVGSNPA